MGLNNDLVNFVQLNVIAIIYSRLACLLLRMAEFVTIRESKRMKIGF